MTTSLDIEIFLKKSGWKNFDRTRLKGDASSRRYERVTSQNQNAVSSPSKSKSSKSKSKIRDTGKSPSNGAKGEKATTLTSAK